MEISALTRSVVRSNHAVISPDGYINSNVPGWTNVVVNVIINEQMGARLCQTLITFNKDGNVAGETESSEIFFYVIEGECSGRVGNDQRNLKSGEFVYVPSGNQYQFGEASEGTKI